MTADAPLPSSLTASRRATLATVVQTVLPHLTASAQHHLIQRIEDRLWRAPGHVTKDLSTALDVLGSGVAGLVVSGRPVPFPKHSEAARHLVFEQWAVSRVPQARTVHQALRKLVLTTWYASTEARDEVGVAAPLHTRQPIVQWEGPLPGERTLDAEPVARQPSHTIGIPGGSPVPRGLPEAVTTANAFSGDRTITADVVVIGSGAGGAVAACRFAEGGRQVVILEEGEYLHAPDFSENEGTLVPRLFADQAMRTTVDASVTLLQGGAVGGGTTVNWMLMLRPPSHVLEEWSWSLGITGFSAADLDRHLDRVESEVHARMAPTDAHSPSNQAILDGSRALGWSARAAMINARACVRAGSCSLGCRYDAKQSALLTYLPRAFSAGATLYTGASVERIEVSGRHGARQTLPLKRVRALVSDARTREVRGRISIEAPVVVLAAGAVGTPVILERSGLGGGGVGRYLRLHPTTAVIGHYPRETYPFAGIPQTALCDEFIRRDASGYGFWIECPALQPALAAAALPGFGAAHLTLMRRLRNSVAFIVLVRDGSGPDRSMGSVSIDRTGRTRIRYRLSDADRDNLQLGIEAAARLHLAAGAVEALSLHTPSVRATDEAGLPAMHAASVAPNRVELFSAHVNGTCRLGVNPATSGCLPSGERHGVRGLYVMDGSLLPTAPGVNPQETIMAMASLLAERAIM